MASVYCSRCNAKITAADSVCPSCGAPTHRLIPYVLGFAVLASCILLYNAYQRGVDSNSAVDRSNASVEDKDPRSQISLFEK